MRGKKKNKRTIEKPVMTEIVEQDDNFYFIVGYTEGGSPYGITWEEYEAEQRGVPLRMTEVAVTQELKLSKQQVQEIVDAYDMHSEGMEFFLNIETGEVVSLQTFDLDEEDEELCEVIEEGFNVVYFRIPHRESNEGYTDMVDFAETVVDQQLRSTLVHILNGCTKIFRRFKDALSSDNEQLERYYLFVEERNRLRVLDWLHAIHVRLIIE